MHRARVAAIALAATVAALLPVASATAAPVVHEVGAGAVSAREYWTAERMREAPLLGVRRAAGGALDAAALSALDPAGPAAGPAVIDPATSRPPRLPAAGARITPPPFSTAQVPPAAMTTYPYSANGRLFGSFGRAGNYSCSATVVNSSSRSVALTAGHCLYERGIGWARRVVFVPAYLNGAHPFGAWDVTRMSATRGWVRSENFHGDFAAVKLASASGPIGDVVGEEGLVWNQPREQVFQAIGYPANRGQTELMWNCVSTSIGADPLDRSRGAAATGIGCDMGGGSSGGGWTIRDSGGNPFVNGVTSYGYKRVRDILFSPYLTGKVVGVVNRADQG